MSRPRPSARSPRRYSTPSRRCGGEHDPGSGQERGRNVAQLAIAWVPARDDGVVALVAARTHEPLADALSVLANPLDAATLAALDDAFAAGDAAAPRSS